MERGRVAVVSCEVDGKVPLSINFDLGQFKVAKNRKRKYQHGETLSCQGIRARRVTKTLMIKYSGG